MTIKEAQQKIESGLVSKATVNGKYQIATIKDNKVYRWNASGKDTVEVKKVESIQIEMIDKSSFEYKMEDMQNRYFGK